MDQFEAAKLKHQKNLERKLRNKALEEIEEAEVKFQEPEVQEQKEEKASKDAIIEVVVKLPDRLLSFSLTKRNVYGNIHPSRMTKQELAKHISSGLEPLMGRVE